jgi:tRNA pseudouridine38-40 synthase
MADVADNTAPEPGRRRFALLLVYDGTRFAGSQLQANALTVQAVLESAIEKATEEPARVAFAGRTDAGVHARGQVASFASSTKLDAGTLRRALNAWLPDDVAVRQVSVVNDGFDPRRHAVRRHYRYLIDNGPVRPVLQRNRVWHVAGTLDTGAMAEAACSIVGVNDFAPFASRLEDAAASTVRALFRFDVRSAGTTIVLDVEANAFLPHQVRRMTGALVDVGRGKLTGQQFAALLDGPPASAGLSAPPRGLCLMRVSYEIDPFCAGEDEEGLDSESYLC